MTEETSFDRFLGGRLTVEQPRQGYRAGADPVFLAAATDAQTGQRVLELGAGSGVALLCLASRVPGLDLTGVEKDFRAADRARKNAISNGHDLRVITADLTELPVALRQETFDHVITNPPFFDREQGSPSEDASREAGRGEDTPLEVWLDVAIRRLSPGGILTAIWPAGRLPDLIRALDRRVGGVDLKPLAPREGRKAELCLIRARKGSKAPSRLLSPLILHDGTRHERDGDSYSAAAKAILKDGKPLEWS